MMIHFFKKNFIQWVAIAALFTAGSCNNSGEEKKEKDHIEDSVETAAGIAKDDSLLIHEQPTSEWIINSLQKNKIAPDNLQLKEFWAVDSFSKKQFTPEKDFYNKYAPLLKWSADSSYVLDEGTYGAIVTRDKNGNTKVEGGDADTEISLLFPKENSKTQLIYSGPSFHFIDGKWLDSTQLAMLTSFDEKGGGQSDTTLWIIDVKSKFFRKYLWR
ncbi:hypothetical protein QTN47_13990 [Danxiaibacter flavus]|uniref:Lipoprotein n=1 Tax=Danxiaibacter flavus TaxID=3049108 RepID=A0ABV3ZGL4_9BACT|nr:hypothetical protein QNM32_13995 [Chitinophagaceae bacterium DXS]